MSSQRGVVVEFEIKVLGFCPVTISCRRSRPSDGDDGRDRHVVAEKTTIFEAQNACELV